MKNILVTIDFNDNEEVIIEKAMQLAQGLNSKLWLMHITAPDPYFVGYEVGPQYIRNNRAIELKEEHKKLEEYSNSLKEKGIDSEGLLIMGATIEMILEESKKLNVDLIITGHHEHGILYNTLFGSTSEEIIKKSKVPVLVIPLG